MKNFISPMIYASYCYIDLISSLMCWQFFISNILVGETYAGKTHQLNILKWCVNPIITYHMIGLMVLLVGFIIFYFKFWKTLMIGHYWIGATPQRCAIVAHNFFSPQFSLASLLGSGYDLLTKSVTFCHSP